MTDILTRLSALTQKDENGLLPCPICAATSEIWTDGRTIHRHWRAGCTAVSCIAIKTRTKEEAIERWNRRSWDSALIALVQEAARGD